MKQGRNVKEVSRVHIKWLRDDGNEEEEERKVEEESRGLGME